VNTCTYCGRENDEQATHCRECGTELANVATAPPVLPAVVSEAPPIPVSTPSDRRLQIAETIIVCAIAFGPSIVYSLVAISGGGVSTHYIQGNSQALYTLVHEAAAVALLWWVLAQRRQSLSSWLVPVRGRDVGYAIVLIITSCIAYYGCYYLLYAVGLTSRDTHQQFQEVTHRLFGSRIALGQLGIAVFNPFFEELIVRAYLITMVKQLTGSMHKAVLTSVLVQTSYHLYQGGAGAMSLSLMFLIYSIYYARTGRIHAPLIAHMYQDVSAVVWALIIS
jgi:membrane protease YdiL (CAAX protease family)